MHPRIFFRIPLAKTQTNVIATVQANVIELIFTVIQVGLAETDDEVLETI